MTTDELSNYYSDLLDGSYECVDRIVLNGYFGLAYSAGGFRSWWRPLHGGSDDQLDNAHLIRMAGRFSRRVRGWSRASGVPVIDCDREERKHEIAAVHLKKNPDVRGVFLVLVGRAVATVWDVKCSPQGVIQNLQTKRPYITLFTLWMPTGDTSPSRWRAIPPLARRSCSTVMSMWPARLGKRD